MTRLKQLGLAMLGGLVAAFSYMPTAHATTYPGKNGNIAFSQVSQGITNVWVVQDGQIHPRQLTYFGATNPVWSPDGQKMVVVSSWGQLHILDRHGKPSIWLPFAAGFTDSAPAWSPDGSRIAFVRTQSGSGRSAIISTNIQTRSTVNISGWQPEGGYRSPSWAPDGRRLVYEQFGLGQRVLLIKNTLLGYVRQLTVLSDDVDSHVAWSPNGKKILFNDSVDQVYTISPDGNYRTVISDGDSRGAAWSPDGTKIAFIEDNGISISETDGTITQVYAGDPYQLEYVAWSPDSSKIAFVNSDSTGASRINTLDVVQRTIKHTTSPATKPETLSWQARP